MKVPEIWHKNPWKKLEFRTKNIEKTWNLVFGKKWEPCDISFFDYLNADKGPKCTDNLTLDPTLHRLMWRAHMILFLANSILLDIEVRWPFGTFLDWKLPHPPQVIIVITTQNIDVEHNIKEDKNTAVLHNMLDHWHSREVYCLGWAIRLLTGDE